MLLTCIDKSRDNNGKIIRYHFVNSYGMHVGIDPNTLRIEMKRGTLEITNLKLSSDGKIIDAK